MPDGDDAPQHVFDDPRPQTPDEKTLPASSTARDPRPTHDARELIARPDRGPHPPSLNNDRTATPPLPSPPHLPPSLPSTSMAESFLPLLRCSFCSPPALLTAPTTLHCGHTVCSSHVTKSHSSRPPSSASSSPSSMPTPQPPPLRNPRNNAQPVPSIPVVPSCPLPTCRVSQSTGPRLTNNPHIPPDSPVTLYPPISTPNMLPAQSEPDVRTVLTPRVDISISRLILLMQRPEYGQPPPETDFVRTLDDKTDSDSEDDCAHQRAGSADDRQSRPHPPSATRRRDPERTPEPSTSAERRVHSTRDSPPSPPQRPPKRQRYRRDPSTSPPLRHSTSLAPADPEEGFNKDLMELLTCEICFMLLYQPVTTPCQHTFCAKCLQRSLDHTSKCPLCRQDLPAFSYFQDHPFNKVLLAITLKAFPDAYADRGRAIEGEERDSRLDTPIFVCQLSFPGMPTLLHFFEPRYRLMLRRCLESPRPCFGMIMPPRTGGAGSTNDFGTMLEIRSVQMLPDGRSMVETWGSYRFRILERGSLDGYMVGRIERIDDVPEDMEDEAENSVAAVVRTRTSVSLRDPSSASPSPPASSSVVTRSPPRSSTPSPGVHTLQASNEELVAICHGFLDQLRNGTAPWVVQRLNNTYGPMPTDPSSFSFWMALVLPIEEHEKAKLLPIKSPRLRLRLVVHWIDQLNSNW